MKTRDISSKKEGQVKELALMDNLNLDAMEVDELRGLIFPLEQMALYAKVKLAAMEARLAGSISVAQAREAECDAIYLKLPEKWRW
jgi:hypothetical protein